MGILSGLFGSSNESSGGHEIGEQFVDELGNTWEWTATPQLDGTPQPTIVHFADEWSGDYVSEDGVSEDDGEEWWGDE